MGLNWEKGNVPGMKKKAPNFQWLESIRPESNP